MLFFFRTCPEGRELIAASFLAHFFCTFTKISRLIQHTYNAMRPVKYPRLRSVSYDEQCTVHTLTFTPDGDICACGVCG